GADEPGPGAFDGLGATVRGAGFGAPGVEGVCEPGFVDVPVVDEPGVVDVPPGALVPAGAGGVACTGPARTGRNRSWAVWPRSLAFSPLLPGTVMVRLLPSCTTSAPLTPSPLTRWSMMPRASVSCSLVGGAPVSVRAVSVTRVPPSRSMPSLGCGLRSPVKNTSA